MTNWACARTRIVRHLETQNFRLYPADETNYRDENRSLDYVSFGTTENIEAQVELVEGALPAPADPDPNSVIEVMIHEGFASEFGMQVGRGLLRIQLAAGKRRSDANHHNPHRRHLASAGR